MSDRNRWEADRGDAYRTADALSDTLRRVRELEAECAALRMENAVLREWWPAVENVAQLRPAA